MTSREKTEQLDPVEVEPEMVTLTWNMQMWLFLFVLWRFNTCNNYYLPNGFSAVQSQILLGGRDGGSERHKGRGSGQTKRAGRPLPPATEPLGLVSSLVTDGCGQLGKLWRRTRKRNVTVWLRPQSDMTSHQAPALLTHSVCVYSQDHIIHSTVIWKVTGVNGCTDAQSQTLRFSGGLGAERDVKELAVSWLTQTTVSWQWDDTRSSHFNMSPIFKWPSFSKYDCLLAAQPQSQRASSSRTRVSSESSALCEQALPHWQVADALIFMKVLYKTLPSRPINSLLYARAGNVV